MYIIKIMTQTSPLLQTH